MSKENNKEEKDEKELINGKFKECFDIDSLGIYCIKIKKEYFELKDFKQDILDRDYIFYIGIATKSLKKN